MMKGMQTDLNKAAVFAAIARQGSFSAGAKAMGLARSTASEHVAALEASLGVRLLERTTRKIELTDEGELLLSRIDKVLRAWDDAREALQHRTGEPTGTLRITAATGLSSSLVGPACGRLVAAHPKVDIELIVDDHVHDIVGERIDVAIRMGPLEDSSLICQKLGSTTTILVDAPQHAVELPDEKVLEAVLERTWVAHANIPMSSVHLHDPANALHVVRPNYRGEGNNTEGQVALISHGCGMSLMPELLVRPYVASGTLAHVHPRWHGREIPIYAVHSRNAFRPPRVDRFLAFLRESLGKAPRG